MANNILPLEIKHNYDDYPVQFHNIHTEQNMIPKEVVANIIKTALFGRKKDLAKLPNNLICMRDGDFWTTWDFVFEVRDACLKEWKR